MTAAGFEAMVLTLLPGTPMSTLYHRWGHTRSPRRVARDLGAVTEWLMRLHPETADGDAPSTWMAATCTVSPNGSLTSPTLRQSSSVWNAPARSLKRHRAPRTVVHGDLWCGNVLVRDGAVSGVVDWEEAELRGEPLRDLARFALTYALYLDRHTRPGARVAGHPRSRRHRVGMRHRLSPRR